MKPYYCVLIIGINGAITANKLSGVTWNHAIACKKKQTTKNTDFSVRNTPVHLKGIGWHCQLCFCYGQGEVQMMTWHRNKLWEIYWR